MPGNNNLGAKLQSQVESVVEITLKKRFGTNLTAGTHSRGSIATAWIYSPKISALHRWILGGVWIDGRLFVTISTADA